MFERCRAADLGRTLEREECSSHGEERGEQGLGEWTRLGWLEEARVAAGRRARLCEDRGAWARMGVQRKCGMER